MRHGPSNSFEIKRVNGGRDRTRTCDLLRVKEHHLLQDLHRFSPTPNIYTNLGNLLFARQQPRHYQQMGFGHSFDTAGKQGEAGGFTLFQPLAWLCEVLDRAPPDPQFAASASGPGGHVQVAREVGSHDSCQGEKAHAKKRTTKRTTQITAARPMTGIEAFEAGRRAYEATAAWSRGAAVPAAESQRAPVTIRMQHEEACPLADNATARMPLMSTSASYRRMPSARKQCRRITRRASGTPSRVSLKGCDKPGRLWL
jgi:hypothetical protein